MASRVGPRKRSVTLLAPAKVNFFLSILGRQTGGLHSIVSLMQMVGLYDRLTIEVTSGPPGKTSLELEGPPIPRRGNLVLKAVGLFRKTFGFTPALRISLKKQIPLGAGLAGGSSDAAATLEGLSRIGKVRIPKTTLFVISQRLGSDVPFFFKGPTAWVSGVGQYALKLPAPKTRWLVLVNPGFEVSTARAYRMWDEKNRGPNLDSAKIIKKLGLTLGPNGLKISSRSREISPLLRGSFSFWNDLEAVTVGEFPVIERIKKHLKALGAEGVMMSGSGPTVFGLFKDQALAHRAAETLRQEIPGRTRLKHGSGDRKPSRPWGIWVARTLSRSPF